MKLTIASSTIALPIDAKISIEKKSPLTNDDTGSFSYPFSVPTPPNQQVLGWPGKLQRSGDIPDKTFILEESGLQIMRGEVDYDDITAKEIGIILKSGYTEFYKKMEGKKLADIDFGSENWPINLTSPVSVDKVFEIIHKINEWNTANTTDNGKYVLSPFEVGLSWSTQTGHVNMQFYNVDSPTDPTTMMLVRYGGWQAIAPANTGVVLPMAGVYTAQKYCLQFKIWFVIRKIFESAGYTIMEEVLTTSQLFNSVVLFGKIITIIIKTSNGNYSSATPAMDVLKYADLMPDIGVLNFLDIFKNAFCLMYEIDERKKEVRIKYKKDVFLPENLDGLKIREMAGWTHNEQKTSKGFTLRYSDQDNKLDTFTDWPEWVNLVTTLPAAEIENTVVLYRGKYYITATNSENALEWQEVGRLREVKAGDGENVIEIDAKIPDQIKVVTEGINFELPIIKSIVIENSFHNFTNVPGFIITLYHGRRQFGAAGFPYASYDRYSLDGTIDTAISLKPSFLYDAVYSEFLNWQNFRARPFMKFIELSLIQLLALQWGKRYNIDGNEIILDKINFELPHTGTVKIEGLTA